MGFDLNALAAKAVTTPVDFMGLTATVTFNPSVLTADRVMLAQKSDKGFVEVFTDLVTDWDVKRGPKKVPITEKGLMSVPLPFLKAVFSTIMRYNQTGDAEAGKASSAG